MYFLSFKQSALDGNKLSIVRSGHTLEGGAGSWCMRTSCSLIGYSIHVLAGCDGASCSGQFKNVLSGLYASHATIAAN